MPFGPLVTVPWLAKELGADGLFVLDASAYLPTEPKDARALYRQAHVPGAGFFDIDAFSDPDTALPHMAPSQGRFARLASALGVGAASRVVVYDQKGLFSAARAWWLFRLFGHERVAVLDGGLPKWLDAGHPVESGEPPPPAPGDFRAAFRPALLRGLGDVLANLDSRDELLIDARARARFEGRAAEPRPGLRAGHIPGSLNLPYTELIDEDGTLKAPEHLREAFAALGVDGGRPVVTTCGSGLTAAVLSLALSVAGLRPGALYDGSWTEWGSRDDTPVATGRGG